MSQWIQSYAAWAFLALFGIVMLVVALPRDHPDPHLDPSLGKEAAIEIAETLVETPGIPVPDDAVRVAEYRRRESLIERLVRTDGRGIVASDSKLQRYAGYWNVRFLQLEGNATGMTARQFHEVHLDNEGRLVSLDPSQENVGRNEPRNPDRWVLEQVLGPVDAEAIRNVPDSLINSAARFSSIPDREQASSPLERLSHMGTSEARTMIDAVLARSGLSRDEWEPDSIRIAQSGLAVGSFYTSVSDQRLDATITVFPNGSTRSISLTLPSENDDALRTIGLVARVGLTVMFGLFFLVAFVRRLFRRRIDMRSAIFDAALIGSMAGLYVLLRELDIAFSAIPWWQTGLILALLFSAIGFLVSVLTFGASAVAGSLGHEVWTNKLQSSALVRRGNLLNQMVGRALVRGVSLGLGMIGIMLAVMQLRPSMSFDIENQLLRDSSALPIVTESFGAAFILYGMGLLLFVGVGSLLRKRRIPALAASLILGIIGGVLHLGPVDLHESAWTILPHTAAMLVAAYVFIRTDFLTVFVGLLSGSLLMRLSEGFLLAGSPAWIDAGVGAVLLLALVGFGIAGASSRRTGRESGDYVPEYILSMATEERILRELEIARDVQNSFLPSKVPDVPGADIAGICVPANEVGGDYYDLIPLGDGRLAVVIGDVSGKGIQAAFFMTLAKGILQTLAKQDLGPAALLRQFNRVFHANVPPRTFISMISGVLDPAKGTFVFARAGHNPVVIKRKNDDVPVVLQPPGIAVGMDEGDRFDSVIGEESVQLSRGDVVVLYTDGLSEAMNVDRELYGDDRLAERIGQLADGSAEHCLGTLVDEVNVFARGTEAHDDMTIVVLRLTGTADA